MAEFPGLHGTTPIGFLAALGMQRVLVEDCGCSVRLAWRNGCAVLEGLDAANAVDALAANMAGRAEAIEFTWADTTRKIEPARYRDAVAKAAGDPRALGFFAGWGSDAVLRDGAVVGTRFDMTSGQQKLLQDLRALAVGMDAEALRVALLGGDYVDQPSFGLDPVAVRSHAHESRAPSKTKPPGKPGLIWLAFESIPLHPVLPVSATRARTTGWRSNGAPGYVWPLWERSLALPEVAALRLLPVDRLPRRPGVAEVWFSRYSSNGKYGMLLPAQRER